MANVAVTNTSGLYGITSNTYIATSAASLLSLLYSNGNVNFSLTGSGSQVQANALVAGGSGTYGNTQVAQYLASNTDPTISNLNANAAVQAVQINTISANLGAFETYANLNFGTNSYANVNVAAYLSSGSVSSNIVTTGNVISPNYLFANGVNILSTVSGGSGTYSNANVASYLPVFGGNILAGNVDIPYTSGTRNRGPLAVGGNLNHSDSGVVASFQGNESTYLYTSLQNTNTGNTAYSSYAVNDATHTYYGELGINSGTYDYAAAGYPNNAFSKPYATFIQSTGANLAIGTYDNNGISFLVNGQTNTADAMTIANTGNVTVTGNLAVGTLATVGNIKSTNGYFWANGTPYAVSGGSYGNTQVAQYLPTYTGNIGRSAGGNYLDLSSGVVLTSSANTNIGGSWVNLTPGTGLVVDASGGNSYFNGGNVNVSYRTSIGGGFLTVSNVATIGNITTTSGIYWANGAAYSSSITGTYGNSNVATFLGFGLGSNAITTGGTINAGLLYTTSGLLWLGNSAPYSYFNGDLGGSILQDSINQRIFANAYPLSTPTASGAAGNDFSNYVAIAPVYSGGQLQSPASPGTGQNNSGVTVISAQTANVALQSSYQTTNNRNTVGVTSFLGVTPVTANTMSNQDRLRGTISAVDVYLGGKTWGTMSTTAQNATTVLGSFGISNVLQSGSLGSAAGTGGVVFVTPTSGNITLQYGTGSLSAVTLFNTGGTQYGGNIVNARLFAGFVSGFSSNLLVQNAIGLHTYNGWAGSGVVGAASNPQLGRYAVLNEDANTTIQTNGNLTVTGNTSLGPIAETQYALGNQTGTVTVSYYNGTVQTATLTGNITLNTNNVTNMPIGGTVTLILTQDATGSRILTSNLLYAGGSKTLSTAASSIDSLTIYYTGTQYLASLVKGYA